MAYIQMQYKSKTTGSNVGLNAIVPYDLLDTEAVPVLYLLHGHGDNNYSWVRNSSIERYVKEKNLVVIMPDGFRSWYTNSKITKQYLDMITDEIPALVKATFNISDKREDTFIAGLSMGGYGAFKAALTKPEKFGFAASLSGALDMAMTCERYKNLTEDPLHQSVVLAYGEEGVKYGDENDLLGLAKKVSRGKEKPVLRQYVGTEDFLYGENQSFKNTVELLGFDYEYEEGPGSHEWNFWDTYIQKVINEIEKFNSKVGK